MDEGRAGSSSNVAGAQAQEPFSDVARLLSVIWAADELGRPLTTAELEAACYLLTTESRNPDLAFHYSFRFAPRPRSDDLYEALSAIENADYARRGSPVTIQDSGKRWLMHRSWGDESRRIREAARRALQDLFARDQDLVQLSLTVVESARSV